MPTHTFYTNLISYNETKIVKLPDDISGQLSSRGMNFAEIMIVMHALGNGAIDGLLMATRS